MEILIQFQDLLKKSLLLATARLHRVVFISNLKERDTTDRRELSEANRAPAGAAFL